MSTKTRRPKSIREREVVDEYRPRLHRTVGVYLALKAWTQGFDCIVLSRKSLLRFFAMKATPRDRMEQIKTDLKPWFQGVILSRPKPNNPTFVNYMFLVRRKRDISYFSSRVPLSPRGVKLLIDEMNKSDDPKAPKSAFFASLVNEYKVPTQEEILSELVLIVAGLKAPEVKERDANQQRLNPTQVGSPELKAGISVPELVGQAVA